MRVPPLPGAGSLPRPRTSFIGRDNELAEARQLLKRARLLTLTGAGGCGKTRFAIAVATAVADDFPAGVHFVSLAAIKDPALVPVSIAQSIGLQDSRGRPLLEHLSGYVADGKLLLVLDNFEHLLSAGEFVGQLLDASVLLRVVVTSRSPLHLSGEQEFPVPPLAVTRLGADLSTAAVASSEAAQLFAERAAASVPGFDIDDDNAAAIAEITDRLGGLPLAIELAAARVKLLPPEAILARLDQVLGDAHVDRATSATTDFTREFQQLITEYAWGTIWTRPGLDRRSRSMITLTALVARGHYEELAMHIRAARRNGLSVDEIKEVLLQTAIYCGVPDANTAFRIAQAVLADEETTPEEDDR